MSLYSKFKYLLKKKQLQRVLPILLEYMNLKVKSPFVFVLSSNQFLKCFRRHRGDVSFRVDTIHWSGYNSLTELFYPNHWKKWKIISKLVGHDFLILTEVWSDFDFLRRVWYLLNLQQNILKKSFHISGLSQLT